MGPCPEQEVLGSLLIQTLPWSIFSCQEFMGGSSATALCGHGPLQVSHSLWEGLLLSMESPGVLPPSPQVRGHNPSQRGCPLVSCPWGCWEESLDTVVSFTSFSAGTAGAAAGLWETFFSSLNYALAEFFIFSPVSPVTHWNSCAELPPSLKSSPGVSITSCW